MRSVERSVALHRLGRWLHLLGVQPNASAMLGDGSISKLNLKTSKCFGLFGAEQRVLVPACELAPTVEGNL